MSRPGLVVLAGDVCRLVTRIACSSPCLEGSDVTVSIESPREYEVSTVVEVCCDCGFHPLETAAFQGICLLQAFSSSLLLVADSLVLARSGKTGSCGTSECDAAGESSDVQSSGLLALRCL